MTTTVKIEAHCNNETEVKVVVQDENFEYGDEVSILQDGDEHTVYAYDSRVITVTEILKSE